MDLDLNCFQRASDGPCQQPWPKYINQVHWTTESQHCWQNYLHLDHYVIWSFKPFSTNPKTSSKPFKPLESFGFEKFKAFCQGSCAFFPFPRSRKTHGTLAQVLKTLSPGCMCVLRLVWNVKRQLPMILRTTRRTKTFPGPKASGFKSL